MEMQNATAAGPSYGLLDVLFGTRPAQGQAPAAEGFEPLLKMLAAMNDEANNGEAGRDRTDKEIRPGMLGEESLASYMPGLMPVDSSMAQPITPDASKEAAKVLVGAALMGDPKAQATVQKLLVAPTSAPSQDDGQMEALLSGMVLGSALSEARLTQDLSRSVEGVNTVPVKEWQAVGNPIASTQDFLKMREESSAIRTEKGSDHLSTQKGAEDILAPAESERPITGKDNVVSMKKPVDANHSVQASGEPSLGRDSSGFGKDSKRGKSLDAKLADSSGLPVSHPAAAPLAALGLTGAAISTHEIFMPKGATTETMREIMVPELAQSISNQNLKGGGEMRLVIHPGEMGEIKLKVGSKGGRVEVSLVAENKEVAEMLRSSSKDLEESLGEHKLHLAKFEVSVVDGAGNGVAEVRDSANLNGSFQDRPGSDGSNRESRGDLGFGRDSRSSEGRPQNNGQEERRDRPLREWDIPSFSGPISRPMNKTNQNGRLDVVA